MRGFESVGAPELLAGGRIVSGDDVAASDHDLCRAAVAQQRGRRVRIGRFEARLGRPVDAPERLAGRLVDPQQVRRIVGVHAVQDLHVQRILVEQRRRGIAPLQAEAAVLLLDVARFHSSLPSKSNALSTPVPVITQTERPSVTGDGDDICCFIMRRLPPPIGRFQRTVPRVRSTAQNDRSRPSPTLRKMCSPQTIGVAPERSGTASFQVMFSVVDQRTGRFFSPLMPFSSGPRHCGQCSAAADAPEEMTASANEQETICHGLFRPERRRAAALASRRSSPRWKIADR